MARIPSRWTSWRATVALAALVLAAGPARAVETEAFPRLDYGSRRTEFSVVGFRSFIIEPTAPRADGTKPWIWYAPTIKRHPGAALTWLMQQLLAQGFCVAGIDVGETFANPSARAGFDAFYRHVTATYGLDRKACLLAQSRGGPDHYLFAAAFPERVACIAAIYPVTDLRSFPGLSRAAAAYGFTEKEMASQLASHNPIENLAPIARVDIPILHLHGRADNVVPFEQNSQALYDRYRALGGRMQLIVSPDHGHEELPVFFESELLLRFLLSQGSNVPPSEGVIP